MTTGIVVGSILLSADQQFGVEELAISASSDLVNGRRVEIHEDGSRHMLAIAGLGEESLVRAWIAKILRIGVGAAIRAKAMFEKVAISTIVRDIVLQSRTEYMALSERLTAPKQSCRAGHQPGPGGREESNTLDQQREAPQRQNTEGIEIRGIVVERWRRCGVNDSNVVSAAQGIIKVLTSPFIFSYIQSRNRSTVKLPRDACRQSEKLRAQRCGRRRGQTGGGDDELAVDQTVWRLSCGHLAGSSSKIQQPDTCQGP